MTLRPLRLPNFERPRCGSWASRVNRKAVGFFLHYAQDRQEMAGRLVYTEDVEQTLGD